MVRTRANYELLLMHVNEEVYVMMFVLSAVAIYVFDIRAYTVMIVALGAGSAVFTACAAVTVGALLIALPLK